MKFNIVTFTVLLAIAIGVNAKGGGAGGGHGSSGGGHGSSGGGHASSGHASTAKATPASKSTTVSEPVRVAPPVVSSGSNNKGSDSDCRKEKKC